MIELFRKNLFFNSLLLLPYVALLRIKILLAPELYVPSEFDAPLVQFIYPFISSNEYVQPILAILFIFIHAVLINRICIKHRLMHELTLFPGVFYVIWLTLFTDFLGLHPVLLANTFLLFAIYELFRTYKKPKASTHIFNVGFWIGIASLIYLPYLGMALLGFVGLLILRSFKWRERMQFFIGLVVPFIWFLIWQLWIRNLYNLWATYYMDNMQSLELFQEFRQGNLILLTGIFILILFYIFSYNQFTIKKTIQVQKKLDILYWLILASIPGLFLIHQLELAYMGLISVASAVFLTMYFLRIRNKMYGEVIHLVILGIIFSIHFNLL